MKCPQKSFFYGKEGQSLFAPPLNTPLDIQYIHTKMLTEFRQYERSCTKIAKHVGWQSCGDPNLSVQRFGHVIGSVHGSSARGSHNDPTKERAGTDGARRGQGWERSICLPDIQAAARPNRDHVHLSYSSKPTANINRKRCKNVYILCTQT